MTKQESGSQEPEEHILQSPIEDAKTTWSKIKLRSAQAGDLWPSPGGAGLSMREQALVTARRIEGLDEHRFGPFCRSLLASDFALLVRLGAEVVMEFNRGQNELAELLGNHDPSEPFKLELETGFEGRKPGEKDAKAPWVSILRYSVLKGADVWDVPPEGLTLGDLGGIGARATGYAEPFVKRMTPADFGRVNAVTAVFLQPFRPTGGTA